MTLVAFMLALALGAVLLLLAVELVLASRRSLVWQAAAAQLERAGERGLSLVAAELRMAGFRAGARAAPLPPGAPGCGATDGWALALAPALAFADRAGAGVLELSDGSTPDCLPLSDLQPGSDLLALRRAAALPSGSPARRVRETQWYLLVDAEGGGDFRYLGPGAGPAQLPADGREPREWRNAIFFVRDYSVVPGDGVPTLCVEQLQGAAMRAQCLVEGVERLHVEFAVDRDGNGEAELRLAAPTAADLRLARRATVYLHLRSLEALRPAGEARELLLGSERVRVSAGDPFLHRVFVRTVPLDNLR
jgi:type IV pilus assembly protein PilW